MKMEQPVPEEVTVIVHSAKGLQGKKPGRHKYSVIFGFGSKKYRTSIVKNPGGNPEWNEESIIKVNNSSDHVFLNVTEKEDILGQVLIPLTSLRSTKGRVVRTALQPHKKNSKPRGDLIYQCYISKFRTPGDIEEESDKSNTNNNWLKNNPFVSLSKSPVFSRKFFKKDRKNVLSTFNKKISRSLHDLFSVVKGDLSDDDDDPEPETRSRAARLKAVSTFTLDCVGTEPEITYITPNKGSAAGGTRITVVGDYLGVDKNDIVTLSICNIDCLSTLEYESPKQIYCTTLPGNVGQGNFVIETLSGGVSVLTGGFSYERNKKAPAPTPPIKPRASPAAEKPTASALGRYAASTPNLMIAQSNEPPSRRPPSPEISLKFPEKEPDVKPVPTPSPTPTKRVTETVVTPKPVPRAATLNRTPEKKVPQERNRAFTLGRTPEKIELETEAASSSKKSPEKSHKAHIKKKCYNFFAKINKVHLKEMKQNGMGSKENSPKTENIEGRFRKNFLKHLRHTPSEPPPAIETVVIENGVSECEESSTEEDHWVEKAKLAELERLEEENRDLKQQNADMKAYIDKLLAKVLIHCPDALAADGDLGPPK